MKQLAAFAFVFFFLLGTGSGDCAYPDKPIKAIVAYEAGASADMAARGFYQLLEKELGQPFVILNKPGAASALAVREIYDSKPDGYAIGISSSINVLKLQGLLPYTHRELSVLGIPSISWSVVAVSAKGPFKTIKDLVEYARANPGKVRMSTTTKGAVYWVQARLFERTTGVKFNTISNPGGATYINTQLGGGHADVGIASYKALQSQIDAGNIRILAVTTSERVPGFTQFPTLKEEGYNLEMLSWTCHIGPKGLPGDVTKKLHSVFKKLAATPEWAEWCATKGSVPSPALVGDEAVKFMDQDAEMQRPILEELGVAKKN